MQNHEALLTIQNLSVVYNKVITALHAVTLEARQGEIVAVLGANGAGKSSLLKCISGLVHPQGGHILLQGQEQTGLTPNRILTNGIAHVPEGRMIVPHFTVQENLMVGAHIADKSTIEPNLQKIFALFPILKERFSQLAGTLSGGEQQMLAIGRALMANPRVLLLDEPSLGLAPVVVDKVMQTIRTISSEQNLTIILVEQNAYIALECSDRAYVLENGHIAMQGPSSELIQDSDLKRKYLAG